MKTIELPFNQKLEISKMETLTPDKQKLAESLIDYIQNFIDEIKEIQANPSELNWGAKLAGMTNQQYIMDRCKLIQRDIHKLAKLGLTADVKK